jgi:anti-anti-sigma regulatory factor
MSTITVGRTSQGFLVRVGHHGTLRESRVLAEFIAHIQPPAEVDLDLSAVAYLDSTFLGSLIGFHKRLNTGHLGHFRICGPVDHARRLMGKTRLDTILPLTDVIPDLLGDEQTISQDAIDSSDLAHFIADAHRKLAGLGGPDSPAYARVADHLEEESGKHPHETRRP